VGDNKFPVVINAFKSQSHSRKDLDTTTINRRSAWDLVRFLPLANKSQISFREISNDFRLFTIQIIVTGCLLLHEKPVIDYFSYF
jgi:hypothetical protein